MPDLDGGGDCPPLYCGSRFPSQFLRLNPLQIGRGHNRYALGMLADKRDKDESRKEKDKKGFRGDEKKKDLKARRKENGQRGICGDRLQNGLVMNLTSVIVFATC